jgi:hydroxypyruvate reductase
MAPLNLMALFEKTVSSLSAERLAANAVGEAVNPGEPGAWHIIALGKVACDMARGAHRALGTCAGGIAACHRVAPVPAGVRLVLGSHPFPNEGSERAGRALLEEGRQLRSSDRVLFLLSGGGSSIAAVPAEGLDLDGKVASTRALLASGVPIEEMNAVRKHLSRLKGGQLGAASGAGRGMAFVLGDVPSGDMASVASGPTCPDPTTFRDCLEIVRGRRVELPSRARARLERGAAGALPETPKPGDPLLARIEHRLLAEPGELARTAARLATSSGIPCEHWPSAFSLPVEELAERIVSELRATRREILLALSGEPTVKAPSGAGRGGRMQHLALLLARSLAGASFRALCAGSDGRDGDTPHCGAQVDGHTAERAVSLGLDLDRAIERFDSAETCRALGVALPAFESGTNLCDLILVHWSPT